MAFNQLAAQGRPSATRKPKASSTANTQATLCSPGGRKATPEGRCAYAKLGVAKLFDRKTALTAAEALNDRVTPLFEQHGLRINGVLTDRGTEFWNPTIATSARSTSRWRTPITLEPERKSRQTKSICERFHKTLLEAFYRIAVRKTLNTAVAALQTDLDAWMTSCNEERTQQGRWCFGKTLCRP